MSELEEKKPRKVSEKANLKQALQINQNLRENLSTIITRTSDVLGKITHKPQSPLKEHCREDPEIEEWREKIGKLQ